MERTWIALIFLGLLCPPLARSGEQDALRYRLAPGQKRVYHIQSRQELAATGQFHPGLSEKVNTDLELDLQHEVLSVDGEQAVVELSPQNVQARVQTGDVRGDMPGVVDLPQVRFRVEMNALGSVASVKVAGVDNLGAEARGLVDSMRTQLGHYFLQLPERPVGIGATWQARERVPLTLAGSPELQLDVVTDYRYEGQELKAGERRARISAVSRMSVSGAGKRLGVPVQADLTGTNNLTFWFDVARGLVLQSQGDLEINLLLTAGQGESAVKSRLAVRLHQDMKLK